MFDVVGLVADAVRDIERRDAAFVTSDDVSLNASFIVDGQIKGEPPRLFRTYAEGNFIEAGEDTPFLQTGEAKYGKPIIDRVISPETTLADATKCILVSFDSTRRSNLSVRMPIDKARRAQTWATWWRTFRTPSRPAFSPRERAVWDRKNISAPLTAL